MFCYALLDVCMIRGVRSWPTQRVAKNIDLPKNWPTVVAKYTDIMPRYAEP